MFGGSLAFNDKYDSLAFCVSLNLSFQNLFDSIGDVIIKALMHI
jgi:hypothetical protein